jgi:hypothetical protein
MRLFDTTHTDEREAEDARNPARLQVHRTALVATPAPGPMRTVIRPRCRGRHTARRRTRTAPCLNQPSTARMTGDGHMERRA